MASPDPYILTETQFGFVWGPLAVTRLISDERGGVLIEVSTRTGRKVEIRSTPKGHILYVNHEAVD